MYLFFFLLYYYISSEVMGVKVGVGGFDFVVVVGNVFFCFRVAGSGVDRYFFLEGYYYILYYRPSHSVFSGEHRCLYFFLKSIIFLVVM